MSSVSVDTVALGGGLVVGSGSENESLKRTARVTHRVSDLTLLSILFLLKIFPFRKPCAMNCVCLMIYLYMSVQLHLTNF